MHMYISLSYSIHGRNKVKGSGKILWYSRGQSPNLLSNKQMHKNLRTSGHRQIQQLFLTITLQEKKNSITFVMPTPTTNTLLFGFGLEAAMLIVRRSEVKRTIVTEPSLSSNPVYQMQTFYIHIYFILFKVAHYTGKYFLKSVTWLW